MRAFLALLCVLLTVGCQPFGGPNIVAPTAEERVSGRPLGAPEAGAPSSLAELLQRGEAIAEEWQDEPVLAEVHVELDEAGAWTAARLVYVAAEADRMLQLETAGAGFTEQRPSLGTVNVSPVPAEALAEVPDFPGDAAPPQELAAAPAAAECDVDGATTVLYASGAPYAWDGTAWSPAPQWRVTVTTPAGGGARLDVATGAGDGCLEIR